MLPHLPQGTRLAVCWEARSRSAPRALLSVVCSLAGFPLRFVRAVSADVRVHGSPLPHVGRLRSCLAESRCTAGSRVHPGPAPSAAGAGAERSAPSSASLLVLVLLQSLTARVTGSLAVLGTGAMVGADWMSMPASRGAGKGHGVPAGHGTALAALDQSLGLAEAQCLGDRGAANLEAGPGREG